MEDRLNVAVRWLRISYITGAVVDGLLAILMLVPSRMGEAGFRYAMGLGATLMFGWTALLLWAYRRPMERKGVLLLTIFPVITGLVATSIWAGATGFFSVARVLPYVALGLALIGLFGSSYLRAARAQRQAAAAGYPS
jgi:hypothetical protein